MENRRFLTGSCTVWKVLLLLLGIAAVFVVVRVATWAIVRHREDTVASQTMMDSALLHADGPRRMSPFRAFRHKTGSLCGSTLYDFVVKLCTPMDAPMNVPCFKHAEHPLGPMNKDDEQRADALCCLHHCTVDDIKEEFCCTDKKCSNNCFGGFNEPRRIFQTSGH
ncbi:hypothetical protein QR680_000484 [Steinernema hermaphroditum]|uniref:Uncharacterized protein n=1 Tax=Steinernema hermaphroditum TaxID=289476 RepID=A0AA39LDN6_9BILA|nr:hypothetical protein QR680_000484 [Steinernema hermaphroditum]